MTEQAISPLRRRMIEDMTIRRFAQKTQHDCPCALFGRGSWQYWIGMDEGIGGSLPRES
jgi:hypothetical protein